MNTECGTLLIDCPRCGLPIDIELTAVPVELADGVLTLEISSGEMRFLCECDR